MPRAILAMRTYPATILLAILLFIATLIITTGSLGKVRSGGDGGDGGSGMGGTGKSGEFGGSGFGGTGGPSPFFTGLDTTVPDSASSDEPGIVATPAVIVVQEQTPQTQESQRSPLQQDIMQAIESNPLRAETTTEIAQGSNEAPAITPEPVLPPVQLVALPEAEVETQAKATEPSPAPAQRQLAISAPESEQEAVQHYEEEPQQLAETITVKLETETAEEEVDRERDNLPERIQRPEIPPFQRIRPVQRPALLPPRVQPMRI